MIVIPTGVPGGGSDQGVLVRTLPSVREV